MVEREMVDGRVALAVELGLQFVQFGAWRWAPPTTGMERGAWVLEARLYWVTGEGLFHSGPFETLEAGLSFLVKWYGRSLD